jgi:hypothetical protein
MFNIKKCEFKTNLTIDEMNFYFILWILMDYSIKRMPNNYILKQKLNF